MPSSADIRRWASSMRPAGPAGWARMSALAALPLVVLVCSPARVAVSAVATIAYVVVAVLVARPTRADRLLLGYVAAVAAFMLASWARSRYLVQLDAAQLEYATSKAFYFTFVVLPLSASVAMIVKRPEDFWPAATVQLVLGAAIAALTVALLGDRFLGFQRYTSQGNLIALEAVIAVQPWVIRNVWLSAALGLLGVAGIMFAESRQSLVAFVAVMLLSSAYWSVVRFRQRGGGLGRRLLTSVSYRYVLLPLFLIGVAGIWIASTYSPNPNARCHCISDRIRLLETNAGDRDKLIGEGLRLFSQSPIIGNGLGSFAGRIADSNNAGLYYQYPHNIPIEIAAETGLVGILLILAPLVAGWIALTVQGIKGASPAVAGLLAVVSVYFIVANLAGDMPSERGLWIFGILAFKLGFNRAVTAVGTGRPVSGSGSI